MKARSDRDVQDTKLYMYILPFESCRCCISKTDQCQLDPLVAISVSPDLGVKGSKFSQLD
jgi:hypothetical protein